MYNRLILFFLLISSFHSYSQKLLKDIASSDASSKINESFGDFKNNLIRGDTLFFLAQDTTHDLYYYKNIWFTTGNAANTKNVTNEVGQFYQRDSYTLLTSFKGKAYYKKVSSSNLYATDGNTITIVKTFGNSTIQKASVIDGWLYVFVSNNTILELWKTDGTEINTSKVTDVYNGSHNFYDSNFLNAGDKLYFSITTNPSGYEPWVTDGTALGTKMLKDILPGSGSGNPNNFEKVGNTVFFYAYSTNNVLKLWETDGTEAGTVMVTNAIGGNTNYNPGSRINYANQLYFVATGINYVRGFYKTDGNTVSLVKNNILILGDIVKMNNLMYFIGHNGSDFELWKSDGTELGTEKIKTILSYAEYYYMAVRVLTGASKIYFELGAYKNTAFESNTQHWVSDGTAAGTINISTLNPNFSTGSYNNQLAVVGDTYYFTAYDAVNGFELWKSNGTGMGTMMVKNINKNIASSDPSQLTALDNDVYFSADDIKYGREIWKTDGAAANTNLVIDWNANFLSDINYSSYISGMIDYNDVVIAQISSQLVKFNKTTPPTVLYSRSSLNPENPEFTRFNNKIYYKGYDGDNVGYELYATDGNTATKVKDFSTGYEGGKPTNFLVWGGLLYFTTENNTKIWKSDGTEAGTILVKDLTGGTVSSKFYATNGLLMFLYSSPTYGEELWKTDGTDAGTTLVKDIGPGSEGAYIRYPAIYNNNLFFAAFKDGMVNLYKSDGSSANTEIFSNVSSQNTPVVFKNKLFFIAYDTPSVAYWLWAIDGNANPVKIQQLTASIREPNAIIMKNIADNLLVFDITPTTARHELWASDGTAAGTKLIKVIRQKELNRSYMNITEYVYNNNKLYFAADDGIHGKELWMWDFDCPEFMTISNAVSQDTVFKVDKYIAGNNKINSGIKVSYGANKYIALNPGFETKSNSVFTASMSGCINVAPSANSTTNEPIFKNYPTKGDFRPTIIQFLSNPSNVELLSVYLSEKSNSNEQNIAWVIDESPDKYILKMRVNGKEYIGYLTK